MKLMKLLFLVDSLSHGGAGKVVTILSDVFQRRGNDVKNVAVFHSSLDGHDYSNNENVESIFMLNEERERITFIRRIMRIRRIIKEKSPDIVIAFTNEIAEYTIIAAFGIRCKVFVSERVDPHVSPENRLLRLIRNPLYFFADGVICQTEEMLGYFPKYVQRKGTVIVNPISEELLSKEAISKEKTVISVGRLCEQKDYITAIDAFGLFSVSHCDYIYKIFGAGPLREDLASYIEQKGLKDKIKLCGHCMDIDEEVVKASMFVMSSLYEGLSNALIEAMALGVPCISTDHPIGDAKMLLSNDCGILVPVNDSSSLASAMSTIADDALLAKRISLNARVKCEAFTVNNVMMKWEQFICR